MNTIDSAVTASREYRQQYRWVIVAALFVVFTVVWGLQYSFGLFVKPLAESLNWSRATVSWAATINALTYALCLVPLGWAFDRFNNRIMFIIASLLLGASFIVSGHISQPWQLYLSLGVMQGVGTGMFGPILMVIVMRWFDERRGLALGITTAGVGFGTLVGGPLSHALISSYGWRSSFDILGLSALAVLLLCTMFIRSSPGATSKGVGGTRDSHLSPAQGASLRQALRSRNLYFILLAQGCATFVLKVVMVHVAPYATDVGVTAGVAALTIGMIGGVSILGRLVMGLAQDKIGAQKCMMIGLSAEGVAMLALPFIRSDAGFLVYAVTFGLAYGGDVPQVPALATKYFGMAAIGVIYATIQTAGNLAGAVGPIAAGYSFDITGSYRVAFFAGAAGLLLGSTLVWRLRPGSISGSKT